jgi:uncharacterized membrane protein SpoIIM required for sporulation
MNAIEFIRQQRPKWRKLEELTLRMERGPTELRREELREVGTLYRTVSSDLAYAGTRFSGTTLLLFLHRLTARAHAQIFRTRGFAWRGFWQYWTRSVPEAASASVREILLAGFVFLLSFVFGLALVTHEERAALLIVPRSLWESVQLGRMWTDNLAVLAPGGELSAYLFTNNFSVALAAFAGGLLGGLGSLYVLVLNGLLLGAVVALCAHHGMQSMLLTFIAAHGFAEISTIIVAGGAGLVLAGTLWNPGPWRRRDALTLRGPRGARLALGCGPMLMLCALVEGFVSPQSAVPPEFKVLLGSALAFGFWSWLLAVRTSSTR